MAKPVIGIVGKHMKLEKYPRPDRPFALMYDEVRRAVIDHGAVPIGVLSPSREIQRHADRTQDYLSKEELVLLDEQLALCDGLFFQGGTYITDFEYTLARIAYERDIPTLGVCCGQTVIAEAFGAEIVNVDPEVHQRDDDRYVHTLSIVPGTRFAEIVRTPEMMVNSRHYRAVISCPVLRAGALDQDGHIEVLEAPDKKFYLATRFHPESLYTDDPIIDRIFQAFVEAMK